MPRVLCKFWKPNVYNRDRDRDRDMYLPPCNLSEFRFISCKKNLDSNTVI